VVAVEVVRKGARPSSPTGSLRALRRFGFSTENRCTPVVVIIIFAEQEKR